VSDRLKKELSMAALQRVLVMRRPPPGLVQHSDRGSQYCSDAYQQMLRDTGIASSMRGRGNCFDNSMVETVFKTLKAELAWRTAFQSRQQAELALGWYIDGFYNPRRRHSALGYRSCPEAWCRSDAPWRAVPRRQVAATGRLTAEVSLTAVMVSSVM
jgi:transposase InsO family protein